MDEELGLMWTADSTSGFILEFFLDDYSFSRIIMNINTSIPSGKFSLSITLILSSLIKQY